MAADSPGFSIQVPDEADSPSDLMFIDNHFVNKQDPISHYSKNG